MKGGVGEIEGNVVCGARTLGGHRGMLVASLDDRKEAGGNVEVGKVLHSEVLGILKCLQLLKIFIYLKSVVQFSDFIGVIDTVKYFTGMQ